MEFTNRHFSPNTFLSRLRPRQYKKVPESTLNAILKNIHDLIQYAVVQVQKIIFGQELYKTFSAFLSFTTLYWLINIVPTFSLAVLCLTLLYIAPLLTSPRGREVAHDAMVHAEQLPTAAALNGKALVQNGKAQAGELSSKGRKLTNDIHRRVENLVQSGKKTAIDQSNQAKNAGSNVSEARADNVRNLPEMGVNAANQVPSFSKAALGHAQEYTNSSHANLSDEKTDGRKHITFQAAK